ncbi:MAG: hypothetical protein C0478_18770 [Planctomyces sp.]|nr:hypothetical protein [Planctomyces sp.]
MPTKSDDPKLAAMGKILMSYQDSEAKLSLDWCTFSPVGLVVMHAHLLVGMRQMTEHGANLDPVLMAFVFQLKSRLPLDLQVVMEHNEARILKGGGPACVPVMKPRPDRN